MATVERVSVKRRGREQVGHQPSASSPHSNADTFGRHDESYIRARGEEPVFMQTRPLRTGAYSSSHEDWRPDLDEGRDVTPHTLEFNNPIRYPTRRVVNPPRETSALEAEHLPGERNDTHRSRRRRRRALALSAAAVITGLAVAAGGVTVLPMLHDKGSTQQPASDKKNLELALPNPTTSQGPTTPPENSNKSNTPPIIVITDKGTITDGNQWNTAAKKTRDVLGHSSIPVTNIVAKMGAYDSRGTSPDPDAAKAGDTFTTLNNSAIQTVDSLEHTPSSDASQAKADAAKIIQQLNNLSPMDTQTFITQYGPQLESLHNDIAAILSSQTDKQPSHSLQKLAGKDVPVTEAQTVPKIATKTTTIFSRMAAKAGSFIRRDSITDGKKAIAALSADREQRQRQLFFA